MQETNPCTSSQVMLSLRYGINIVSAFVRGQSSHISEEYALSNKGTLPAVSWMPLASRGTYPSRYIYVCYLDTDTAAVGIRHRVI